MMDQPRSHYFLIGLTFCTMTIATVQSMSNGWPTSGSRLVEMDWAGTWSGLIQAHPDGQLGHGWNKTMIIGPYPIADETCTTWNSTFTEGGLVQLIKDYRFCRGHGTTDLYVDVGNGEKLIVQWVDDILVAPFKTQNLFTISTLRMRGEHLEEEVIIADDKPAAENGITSMRAHSIHRIKMKRISDEVCTRSCNSDIHN